MTFDELNLNTPLWNALKDLGYTQPTPVQEKIFPVVMSGRDVVGIAQTGTGKTFAYLLPLLRQLKFSNQKQPRVLIVVPTRELVLQVTEEIHKLSKYINVRIAGVYGGTNINNQKEVVHQGLDILVATPGRLLDLCLSGVLRLKSVQKFVIDEVDEMLHLGFRPQLINIIEMLPPQRQNLLFSATITEEVDKVIEEFFNMPHRVEVAASGTLLKNISQVGFHILNFNTKVNFLKFLFFKERALAKVLIFIESKSMADHLYEKLIIVFPDQIEVIHSNKTQNHRINSLKKFEEGQCRVLIATDLVARGIDIKNVTHVINFDIPQTPEDYIHRIGRTGRASQSGTAFSLITASDEDRWEAIEKLTMESIPVKPLPEEVEISDEFLENEKPVLHDKSYLKIPLPRLAGGGAFHEKKDKNKKVNLGGSYKRMIKEKYKKPIKRGGKKK